jgi:hypothetical protein
LLDRTGVAPITRAARLGLVLSCAWLPACPDTLVESRDAGVEAAAHDLIDAAPHTPHVTLSPQGSIVIDDAPIFPLGLSVGPPLSGVTSDGQNGNDVVVSAGINFLRANPKDPKFSDDDIASARALLDAAAARKAYGWVYLRDLSRAAPGTADEQRLRVVVAALQDHAALALWKGSDEPWWDGYSADSLRNAYQVTKSLDPDHLWTLIEAPKGTAADLAPYSAVTDVHGVDIYPVAYGVTDPDLHAVGRWTALVRSITPDQAVSMTLQICFSGSDNATHTDYVLPTRKQERYMIYDAIISGARSLWFWGGDNPYCMTSQDQMLGWNWTFWNNVLKNLISEIGPASQLYPALLVPGTGLDIVANNTALGLVSRQVGSKDIWVLAASHATSTATVRLSGLPNEVTTGTVYMENRSVTVSAGAFSDSFERWGVHVYHFQRP